MKVFNNWVLGAEGGVGEGGGTINDAMKFGTLRWIRWG